MSTQLKILLLALLSLFFAGCATTSGGVSDERREVLSQDVNFIELDAQLDVLENETNDVDEAFKEIEKSVISRVQFESTQGGSEAPVHVVLTSNNVLIVDGGAMSRNDFLIFAKTNLPARCKETPELVLEGNIDIDMASWVLEVFYGQGCLNVDIK